MHLIILKKMFSLNNSNNIYIYKYIFFFKVTGITTQDQSHPKKGNFSLKSRPKAKRRPA